MTAAKVCPVCEQGFEARNLRAVYCCRKCANQASNRRRRGQPISDGDARWGNAPKRCAVCGAVFTPKRSDSARCSKRCMDRARYRAAHGLPASDAARAGDAARAAAAAGRRSPEREQARLPTEIDEPTAAEIRRNRRPETEAALRAAADLIDADGWQQGTYRGPRGERCCSAALADAAGPAGMLAAAAALSRQLGGPHVRIEDWNDAPFRTAAEVVAALRAAADAEERSRG